MPCGSTHHISIRDTSQPSFPALGCLWRVPLAWLAGIALASQRRRQYTELLDLDDRLLADIGVSREAIEDARNSSWRGIMTRYVDR